MSFDNLSSSDWPHFVYLSLLLLALASSVIFKSHLSASQLLKQMLGWVIIILVILVGYSFRYDFIALKNRVSRELFPSKIVRVGERQIAINISNDGHFYIDLKINSEPVRFMVDTGASDIVIGLADAKRVGIDIKNITSFRRYQTANGSIISGIAKVREIELDGIKFYNVTVSVNNQDMGTSLLGMSFLERFEKYEVYQNRLILTIPE